MNIEFSKNETKLLIEIFNSYEGMMRYLNQSPSFLNKYTDKIEKAKKLKEKLLK